MAQIHVLDPHVVNQIAAGEVVDRPASVVRELIDNALDAHATRIDIRLRDGGLSALEVADNGEGIGEEDLLRVFLPHATSKIRSVEDLGHIASLGFRGEALASIGAVARVRVTSRSARAKGGHTISNHEGRIGTVEPASASRGTVVSVEGLFHNVPARRKFLRTAQTERGHVRNTVARFAVAFPHVAFRLLDGTRTLLEAPATEDRRTRLAAILGAELAGQLLEARGSSDALHLEAWIGPPTCTRRDGRYEQVLLNGRFIRDRSVAHALREAYRDLLPPGGHRPIAFLFLSCPPDAVDVNVHPQKSEVRWHDAGRVHRLVRRTLRQRLASAPAAVRVPVEVVRERTEAAVQHALRFATGRPAGTRFTRPPMPRGTSGGSDIPAPNAHAPAHAPSTEQGASSPAGLRPIGQALGTYLLLEGEGEIVVVDQHALHERVLFDQINNRLRAEGGLEVQHLLVPKVVHLDAASAARLLEARDWLKTLGWVLETFGEDAIAVQGVPAVSRRPDPEAALRDVLEVLERGEQEGMDRTDLLSHTVDSLACRSAVMAGDRLSNEEILALLAQAEALDHSHSCPHGRPTRLTLREADLEKWFHRTV